METELPQKNLAAVMSRFAVVKFLMLVTVLFPAAMIHESTLIPIRFTAAPESPQDFKRDTQGLLKKASKNLITGNGEERFQSYILAAANRYKVDPALVKAVIKAESSYDPAAVSEKGARGLMQLMPGTAEALGVEEPFNPEQNIHAGVKYIRQLLNQFEGDLELALAAYNAGSKKVKEYHGIPPFKTTQLYLKKVFQYYRHYQTL
ncbi:MAG: lytic transglycosylase domain-containing protein [Pseudomonadota bacterium]